MILAVFMCISCISCAFTTFATENNAIEGNYADEDLFIEYCIKTIIYAYIESETLETIIILDTFQKNDVIKEH